MDNKQICQLCGAEKRFIQAGVSKNTGKPYSAFWACPNRCITIKNTPLPELTPVAPQNKSYQAQPAQPVDWDKIAEGKVRHGVAIAFIEKGKTFDEAKLEMGKWVNWIMKGSSLDSGMGDNDPEMGEPPFVG